MTRLCRILIIPIALLAIGCLDTSYSAHFLDDGSYVLRFSSIKDESTTVFSIEEVVHGNAIDEYLEVSSHVDRIPGETPFLFATVQSNELVGKMTFPVFDIVSDRYEFLTEWIDEQGIEFYIDHSAVERVWVPISCNDDHKICQSELDIIGEAYQRSQQN